MRCGHLFNGIGGFALAADWMGWENVFHCEINEFCNRVMGYHFPKSIQYADITKTDFTIHNGQIDVLTGGFPCQPYSQAGKRRGTDDERHLWPEMLRAIGEIKPRWVVGENVYGIVNWNGGMVFEEVQADLENEGYEVQPYILPAAGVGAPHQRYRVWFVAYSSCERLARRVPRQFGSVTGTNGTSERGEFARALTKDDEWEEFPTQSPVCSGDDGVSPELDGITFSKWRRESIKAYGNAIVPQVAYQLFKTIETYSKQITA